MWLLLRVFFLGGRLSLESPMSISPPLTQGVRNSLLLVGHDIPLTLKGRCGESHNSTFSFPHKRANGTLNGIPGVTPLTQFHFEVGWGCHDPPPGPGHRSSCNPMAANTKSAATFPSKGAGSFVPSDSSVFGSSQAGG